MRGLNTTLVVTTVTDEATGTEVPKFAFPVQVCKATSETSEPRFDRATPVGNEYSQVYRDAVTGEIYENGDLIQGVRAGESFHPIAKEQIDAINESVVTKEIRVERTVNLADVPFERATGYHYLQVPAKNGAAKPFRLLYEALLGGSAKSKTPARALRVTYAPRSRKKLGVIFADPTTKCLVLVTLTYGASVREPDEQVLTHLNVEVDKGMVDKAREVIDSLDTDDAGDWDTPEDETLAKREELIAAAIAGEGIEVPDLPAAPIAADEDAAIEAALEASLA